MPEASAKRPFDHPADEAAAVFKPFIAQSRVQLFYVAEVIAVQGKPAETGLARVPQLEQRVKIVSEESGFSSGAVYEGS